MRPLWQRSALRAATSTASLVGAAAATLGAAALWNPLPLVLYALGAALAAFLAASSRRFSLRVLEEERARRDELAETSREPLVDQLREKLREEPFASQVRAGALPDYAAAYLSMRQTRDRLATLLRAHRDRSLQLSAGLDLDVDELLTSYLTLALGRLSNLEALARAPSSHPKARSERGQGFEPHLAELRRQIAELEAMLEREASTAEIRRAHLDVLRERVRRLEECAARDARVAAQLEALPDLMRLALERVSASEGDELAGALGGISAQVEEARRWAEEPDVRVC